MHLRHSKFYPLTLALSRRERGLFARDQRQHIPGPHKLAAGFTLIEMIVFIVVLAVGLSGVVLVINRTLLSAPEALVTTRAIELSQLYMDEILSKKFDEHTGQGGVPPCNSPDGQLCTTGTLGPEPGETRATFNDVDDYHDPDFQAPQNADGNPLDRYADFAVRVTVEYAGADINLANDLAKRITVEVRTPRGQIIPVVAYRTNF